MSVLYPCHSYKIATLQIATKKVTTGVKGKGMHLKELKTVTFIEVNDLHNGDKRFLFFNDIPQSIQLAESRIMSISGGDVKQSGHAKPDAT
ncbi:hypothetical protein L1987_33377 [Smallanthus sonchifolius]|uniref:Uncharacterized protein n=1 Tax=Smallanthus sonchifolius TaxID=185202 RepID=A0ACB9HS26_9ASTR|nr:hypothetical protein L1987_33377 [Smallanthus sonchifolius]